jgi:hypothetical protein
MALRVDVIDCQIFAGAMEPDPESGDVNGSPNVDIRFVINWH